MIACLLLATFTLLLGLVAGVAVTYAALTDPTVTDWDDNA